MTHPAEEACPFASDGNPIGMMATCCSFRGKILVYALEALGEDDLAEGLDEPMSASQALRCARRLREVAKREETIHRNTPENPDGIFRGSRIVGAIDGEDVMSSREEFNEALHWLRRGANWYEKVGRLGFGVHPWS